MMLTQDPFFNLYGAPLAKAPHIRLLIHINTAQVVGHKTVWLAPPSASPHMYPYPSSFPTAACAPAASEDAPRNPAANSESQCMSNTSRVDVFSPGDVANGAPLRDSYPDFWKNVAGAAMSVTLAPGDLLFFPPGWWHAMRSEETSFSVSMWF